VNGRPQAAFPRPNPLSGDDMVHATAKAHGTRRVSRGPARATVAAIPVPCKWRKTMPSLLLPFVPSTLKGASPCPAETRFPATTIAWATSGTVIGVDVSEAMLTCASVPENVTLYFRDQAGSFPVSASFWSSRSKRCAGRSRSPDGSRRILLWCRESDLPRRRYSDALTAIQIARAMHQTIAVYDRAMRICSPVRKT
jgi:hypothetical protein